jgi:hypothetical protein
LCHPCRFIFKPMTYDVSYLPLSLIIVVTSMTDSVVFDVLGTDSRFKSSM